MVFQQTIEYPIKIDIKYIYSWFLIRVYPSRCVSIYLYVTNEYGFLCLRERWIFRVSFHYDTRYLARNFAQKSYVFKIKL